MPKGWVPEVCVSYDVLTTYISEQSDGGLSSEFRNVAWLFVWGFGFFLCGGGGEGGGGQVFVGFGFVF